MAAINTRLDRYNRVGWDAQRSSFTDSKRNEVCPGRKTGEKGVCFPYASTHFVLRPD